MPSSLGIGPERELEDKSRNSRERRPPIVGEIMPAIPLLERLRPVTRSSFCVQETPCQVQTLVGMPQLESAAFEFGPVRADLNASKSAAASVWVSAVAVAVAGAEEIRKHVHVHMQMHMWRRRGAMGK